MSGDLLFAYARFRVLFRDHGIANRLAHVAVAYWSGALAG